MANLNIRVPDGLIEKIDQYAKEHGQNKTDFVLKAIDMLLNFDEVFFSRVNEYSKGLNIPEWLVIQNMIIKQMAIDAAETEVWGPLQKPLKEFISVNDGTGYKTMTGEELFIMLKKQFVQDNEKEKIRTLLDREPFGRISEDDRKFLIKHRAGRSWLESEEYKKEKEEQAAYEKLKVEGIGNTFYAILPEEMEGD